MAVRDGKKRFLDEKGMSSERLLYATYVNLMVLLGMIIFLRALAACLGFPWVFTSGFPKKELMVIVLPAIQGVAQSSGVLLAELARCKGGGFNRFNVDPSYSFEPPMFYAFGLDLLLFFFFPSAFLVLAFFFVRNYVSTAKEWAFLPFGMGRVENIVRYEPFIKKKVNHLSLKKMLRAIVQIAKLVRKMLWLTKKQSKKEGEEAAASDAEANGTTRGNGGGDRGFVSPFYMRAAGAASVAPHQIAPTMQKSSKSSKVGSGLWMHDPLFTSMFGVLYMTYNRDNWWFFTCEALVELAQVFAVTFITREDDAPAVQNNIWQVIDGLRQPFVILFIRASLLVAVLIRRPYAESKDNQNQVMGLAQQLMATVLLIIGATFPALMPVMCFTTFTIQMVVPILFTLWAMLPKFPPLLDSDGFLDQDVVELLVAFMHSLPSILAASFLRKLRAKMENLYPFVENLDHLTKKAKKIARQRTARKEEKEEEDGEVQDTHDFENSDDAWLEHCVRRSEEWFKGNVWQKRTSYVTPSIRKLAYKTVELLDSGENQSVEGVKRQSQWRTHRFSLWLNGHPNDLSALAAELMPGDLLKKVVIAQLKPKLEPQLPTPLTWADVELALERIDSIDEMRKAVDDPEAFFKELKEKAVDTAKKKEVIVELKPKLEPMLPKPLSWADVQPALERIYSINELRKAVNDPKQFFMRLTTTAVGPAAKKKVIAHLKPKLEPQLPTPLTWADVEPALELIDSVGELRKAVDDPKEFGKKLTQKHEVVLRMKLTHRIAVARAINGSSYANCLRLLAFAEHTCLLFTCL